MDNNTFFSIDRLVEFGMGTAIAQQMVNSMNASINGMQIPGAGSVISNQETVYYAVIDQKQAGPFSTTELARLMQEKKISKETYIWKPGMKNWDVAENISEVLKLVALSPPPIPE